MQKKYLFLSLALTALTTLIAGTTIYAANSNTNKPLNSAQGQNPQNEQESAEQQIQDQNRVQSNQGQGLPMQSRVSGAIASIDGNTITLESNDSYKITIDASGVDFSDFKVGDFISIQGDISVIASEISRGQGQGESIATENQSATGTMNIKSDEQSSRPAAGIGIWNKITNFFGKLFGR